MLQLLVFLKVHSTSNSQLQVARGQPLCHFVDGG